MADSSPQFGKDWFMQEVRLVQDISNTLQPYKQLCAIVADFQDPYLIAVGAIDAWAHDAHNASDLATYVDISLQLSAQILRHALPPAGVATRHRSVLHKLHNLLHAWHLDSEDKWGGAWVWAPCLFSGRNPLRFIFHFCLTKRVRTTVCEP